MVELGSFTGHPQGPHGLRHLFLARFNKSLVKALFANSRRLRFLDGWNFRKRWWNWERVLDVCICLYINVCKHLHIYTWVYIYIYTYIYRDVHIRLYMCIAVIERYSCQYIGQSFDTDWEKENSYLTVLVGTEFYANRTSLWWINIANMQVKFSMFNRRYLFIWCHFSLLCLFISGEEIPCAINLKIS